MKRGLDCLDSLSAKHDYMVDLMQSIKKKKSVIFKKRIVHVTSCYNIIEKCSKLG